MEKKKKKKKKSLYPSVRPYLHLHLQPASQSCPMARPSQRSGTCWNSEAIRRGIKGERQPALCWLRCGYKGEGLGDEPLYLAQNGNAKSTAGCACVLRLYFFPCHKVNYVMMPVEKKKPRYFVSAKPRLLPAACLQNTSSVCVIVVASPRPKAPASEACHLSGCIQCNV